MPSAPRMLPTDGWRRLSRIKRGEYFDEFVQLLKKDREEISRLVTKECGRELLRAVPM